MTEAIPINLEIDHDKKLLIMSLKAGEEKLSTSMNVDEISRFMALLSQCQHVLVLSLTGHEEDLPFDPAKAFAAGPGRHAIGAYEVHRRHAVGIDGELGAVAMTLLSRVGRLTGIRMSPDAARNLGRGLLQMADEAPSAAQIQ